jgi:glycosyltransferase involved in cell wall biosynthesis
MRILYLCHQYWPALCGSGIFFQEMAERLAREGHEVTVFTTDALHFERFLRRNGSRVSPRREVHRGVSIRRFPLRHLPGYGRYRWRLARLPFAAAPYLFSTGFLPGMALEGLRSHRVDAVHAGLVPYGMLLYLAATIARRACAPLIYSPFLHTGEPHDDRVLRIHTDRDKMKLLAQADAVIAQTPIEAEALAGAGVPRDRITVVGMGVNPADVLGGDGERFRNKYGVRGCMLFSVGPKAFDKGARHTVQAFERLLRNGCDGTLVLAGPTFEDFRSFHAALAPSTRERLVLIEHIEGDEKKDLFAAGDIFVMPSRNESFGMVYLEAWACGLPVVGCAAGGVPAVITDGRDGFLVPFGDVDALAGRLQSLLDDRQMRREMGGRGRDNVLARYTWDIQYGKVTRLYATLSLPVGIQ